MDMVHGWEALVTQHAGQDKWDAEVKKHSAFLVTYKWKGSGNFLLEGFCAKHRMAYEQLKAAVAHGVTHQIPTSYTATAHWLSSASSANV